ncbi:MAG TPA: response regulator [Flavobacterium sp.]|jgi:two-component system response regulator NreC|nr:response regulator [Flavobacterium sp.]HPJ10273.1 response regulator [Flavobacterium sp.]
MESDLKILIVDDHPMMVEGYRNILLGVPVAENAIVSAGNCTEAHQAITMATKPFDMILLDMNLPGDQSAKLESGEDLAVLIRKSWPESKIVISTSHTETILLFNLIKRINPEGVLIKSDFSPVEFLTAFERIMAGETYHTATARQSLKNVYVDSSYLDAYNRRIIALLAKGIATKNLPDYLNITISAIDKRKAQIKEIFNIYKGSDEDIIREAKERGLV